MMTQGPVEFLLFLILAGVMWSILYVIKGIAVVCHVILIGYKFFAQLSRKRWLSFRTEDSRG